MFLRKYIWPYLARKEKSIKRLEILSPPYLQMNEYLLEAREELKRLEHIIYVSLKYTRTVDVIRNALHRMVSTFDLLIEAFLEEAKEENKIEKLPKSPGLRGTVVAELFPEDEDLQRYLYFYSFLKTILNLPYERREEYRRHVTLIVNLEDNRTVEMTIDNLTNCERYIHKFLKYSWKLIEGVSEEEEDDF